MSAALQCGHHKLVRGQKTYVMGIINVTRESFSDGGLFYKPEDAVAHGLQLIRDGADILDVGGVSTAPHVTLISEQEELDRVLPVIEGLKASGIDALSIDTMRANVAQRALDVGASWINDQSAGLFDPDMPEVMAQADAVVLMHNGGGKTSGVAAGEQVLYHDVMAELREFFWGRIKALSAQGVVSDRIVIDPGIGFGKGLNDSLAIINGMDRLSDIGALRLIGISRKSVIGALSGIKDPKERDIASLGAVAVSVLKGTDIVRTHNVRAAVEFLRVFDACRR